MSRRNKTRKNKGGKMHERIGIMNPTWGGALKYQKPFKGIKSKLKKTRRNKIKN